MDWGGREVDLSYNKEFPCFIYDSDIELTINEDDEDKTVNDNDYLYSYDVDLSNLNSINFQYYNNDSLKIIITINDIEYKYIVKCHEQFIPRARGAKLIVYFISNNLYMYSNDIGTYIFYINKYLGDNPTINIKIYAEKNKILA